MLQDDVGQATVGHVHCLRLVSCLLLGCLEPESSWGAVYWAASTGSKGAASTGSKGAVSRPAHQLLVEQGVPLPHGALGEVTVGRLQHPLEHGVPAPITKLSYLHLHSYTTYHGICTAIPSPLYLNSHTCTLIPSPSYLPCHTYNVIQGGWSFLPLPNFPMCQNQEKKQSHELATLWNDQVQDLPPPKNGRVPDSGEFRGCKFRTLPFFWGGKSGLSHFRGWPVQDSVLFWILAHRKIWGWQEGSATLYLHRHTLTIAPALLYMHCQTCTIVLALLYLGNSCRICTVGRFKNVSKKG